MLYSGSVDRIAGAPFSLSTNLCTAATVIRVTVVIILGVGVAVRAANITRGKSELSMKVKNRSYHYVPMPFGFRFPMTMNTTVVGQGHTNGTFSKAIRSRVFPQWRTTISQ